MLFYISCDNFFYFLFCPLVVSLLAFVSFSILSAFLPASHFLPQTLKLVFWHRCRLPAAACSNAMRSSRVAHRWRAVLWGAHRHKGTHLQIHRNINTYGIYKATQPSVFTYKKSSCWVLVSNGLPVKLWFYWIQFETLFNSLFPLAHESLHYSLPNCFLFFCFFECKCFQALDFIHSEFITERLHCN